MLATELMIPEILRKLQTTGEEVLGKLEESKDKRAEVVAWCGQGMEILGEYINQNEKATLFTQVLTSNLMSKQPQENGEIKDFKDCLQELSSSFASDVESIVREQERKISKLLDEIHKKS